MLGCLVCVWKSFPQSHRPAFGGFTSLQLGQSIYSDSAILSHRT